MKKKFIMLAILAFWMMACASAKPALANRNIYGYVYGNAGINKGDVLSITIYDDTAGGSSDLLSHNTYYSSSAGALRYYCNNLLTNHEYHIIVVYNYNSFAVRRDFYLPSWPWYDQKVTDIHFGGA